LAQQTADYTRQYCLCFEPEKREESRSHAFERDLALIISVADVLAVQKLLVQRLCSALMVL
jgi:hypothetical protein